MLAPESLEKWHKIIGMRNAIVHDYLNLDARILKSVVTAGRYKEFPEFIAQLISAEVK